MNREMYKEEFDSWWDETDIIEHEEGNPFRKGSPVYWAWAGFMAAKSTEPLNDLEMGEIINSEVTIKDPALYDSICAIIKRVEKLHDIGVEFDEDGNRV